MISKNLTVENPNGLHMRVACRIMEITKSGSSKVSLSCSNEKCVYKKADGCSVIDMLLLGASAGKKIFLTVKGSDEKEVAERIEEIFAEGAGI